jgi:hypothetical protein
MTYTRFLTLTAFAAVAHAMAGCATTSTSAFATNVGSVHTVLLDGKAIRAAGKPHVLLEFLRTTVSRSRLDLTERAQDKEPMLMIDAVVVRGTINTLANMIVADVKRVTTLRSRDAFFLYGPPGYYGAILVETVASR